MGPQPHTTVDNFKPQMRRLSLALMHNPIRAAELASLNPQKTPTPPGTFRTHCHGVGDGEHVLVPLKTIQGCNMCNRGCTWVCITCSPSPDRIFPCHPPKTRAGGGKAGKCYDCFEQHKADPCSAPRASRKTKRVRPDSPEHVCQEVDDEDE